MTGAERERSGRKIGWAGAEREREGRGAGAEWGAGVTKIGLSGERQIGCSRSAHMHWSWHAHMQQHSMINKYFDWKWQTNLSNVAPCRKVDARLFPSRTRSTGSEIPASSRNVGNKSIKLQTWLETWIKHYHQLHHSVHGSAALY